MKIALLISGQLRQYWITYRSILKNLIIPYNMDVFLVTGSNTIKYQTYFEYISENNVETMSLSESRNSHKFPSEIQINEFEFCKKTIGKYLKGFNKNCYIKNYWEEYHNIVNNIRFNNKNIDKYNKVRNIFLERDEVFRPYDYVVLQFMLLSKGIELIENYENKNGFKYDYIFKIRPDIEVSNIINLKYIFKQKCDIYVSPYYNDNKEEYIYSKEKMVHEYMFLFKRKYSNLIKNYPYMYGHLIDDQIYNINMNTKSESYLTSEIQFRLFLEKYNLKIGGLTNILNIKYIENDEKKPYYYIIFLNKIIK